MRGIKRTENGIGRVLADKVNAHGSMCGAEGSGVMANAHNKVAALMNTELQVICHQQRLCSYFYTPMGNVLSWTHPVSQ